MGKTTGSWYEVTTLADGMFVRKLITDERAAKLMAKGVIKGRAREHELSPLPRNVDEMVRNYLRAVGADGLCGTGCGCGIDNLFPCEGLGLENDVSLCAPARRQKCTDSESEWYGEEIYVPMEEKP